MENKIEKAPKGMTYLTEENPITGQAWMTEIPANCVFNKGVTGCGATTLAIKQPGNTILAMPFVGLVDNKTASNPEVLGIHGKMKQEEEIIKYLESHDTYKIATTYNSFPVVCKVLKEQGLNPYDNFFLFVDEWHILLQSYEFRYDAITALLDEARYFKNRTYVSATPIPREYWPTELMSLPEYKMEWPDAETIKINSIQIDEPLIYIARLCKARATKGGDDNYHVFLNSVDGIATIVRLAGLNPNQCRIVCSMSDDDKKKHNQEKLGIFPISTNQDPVRMFNFYTSTCFEGQDIFDENGRTFIVSEKWKDHTKLDVMTTIPQICGRIRDSKYRTEIKHFYAESAYKDVTPEEFKKTLEAEVSEAKVVAELLDQIPAGARRDRAVRDFVKKDWYITEKDGKIFVDENVAKRRIWQYDIVNGQYKTQYSMNKSLESAGFKVSNELITVDKDEELEEMVSISKTSFKDIFEEYVEIRTGSMFNPDCFRRSRIEVEKPLVKEAYEVLGADKVREMKYHQSNIKREITKREHETLDTKVFLLLDGQLAKQVAIPKADIKKKLQDIYDELGMNKKANATDIKKWYSVKETTRRANNGGMQACFSIICANIKVAR